MKDQPETGLVRAPEIIQLFAGDPFFERAQEVTERIALRAYELFESSGFTHGHDREDWTRAESEILVNVPLYVLETATELIIRVQVPGFNEKDLEVRTAPRSLCITGKRQQASEQEEGKAIYSESRADQVFRVLDLPSQIDPGRVNATLNDGILEIRVTKVGIGTKVAIAKAASA
jgi:HSP20 family protein